MSAEIFKVRIIQTGEEIEVYRLSNGNYYDYHNMGVSDIASAPKAGKKEFKKKELLFI